MDLDLKGRVALVTGAARGMGFAEAQTLAEEGARIALNDTDAEAAEAAAARLRAAGATCETFVADVAEEAAAETLVAQVDRHFGRLDVLVNNAGIGGRHMGTPVAELPAEAWDEMIRVHLRGTFLCSRAALRLMSGAGFGRIVNISSMNFTGGGRPGVAHYATAKAGIAGFTRTLAKEVGGAGVTVNAVAPGYVETDLIRYMDAAKRRVIVEQNPVGRFCQPEEVGALVAFLCSRQAAFVNGALVCLDGGRREFYWEAA
ncbi:short-chain dehydrogenase [Phormidium willei BDU 130791]|nr:short-chain dehydrogenase [Phormidium willei BDU 130791]